MVCPVAGSGSTAFPQKTGSKPIQTDQRELPAQSEKIQSRELCPEDTGFAKPPVAEKKTQLPVALPHKATTTPAPEVVVHHEGPAGRKQFYRSM